MFSVWPFFATSTLKCSFYWAMCITKYKICSFTCGAEINIIDSGLITPRTHQCFPSLWNRAIKIHRLPQCGAALCSDQSIVEWCLLYSKNIWMILAAEGLMLFPTCQCSVCIDVTEGKQWGVCLHCLICPVCLWSWKE